MVYKIVNGGIPSGDQWMSNSLSALKVSGRNLVRLLQNHSVDFSSEGGEWAEAYVDSDGREDSVDTGATTAVFDTDKYSTFIETVYVQIEASSLTTNDFSINNCLCKMIEAGKWVLYCTTGTDEVKRAQIYKTLFYGSDGTNPRASDTYITGITALKTSITRDVGKRAFYVKATHPANDDSCNLTGTFADTSGNDDCSTWSYVYNGGQYENAYSHWEVPSGTVRNTADYETRTSDETGTDTTGDETDNPATCKLRGGQDSNVNANRVGKAIILCVGGLSWVANGSTNNSEIDFYIDNSIPLLTVGDLAEESLIITHNIPSGTFSSTISTSFGTALVEDWEEGDGIQYKLTGTGGAEDTGWLNYNEVSTFTAFTAEPDTCIVKLIPKSTNPTLGYPSVKGFMVGE